MVVISDGLWPTSYSCAVSTGTGYSPLMCVLSLNEFDRLSQSVESRMTRRVSTGGSRTHMKNMMQKQQMEQDEQRRRDLSISSPASSLDSSASSLDSSGIHNSHHSVNTFNQGSFDGGFSNSHHANFGNIPHSHSSGHLGGAHSFTDASLTRSNFMQTGGHDSFGGTVSSYSPLPVNSLIKSGSNM